MKSITNLIEKAAENEARKTFGSDPGGVELAPNALDAAAEYYFGLMTGYNYEGESVRFANVDIKETLTPSDAPIVMKRVISEVLLQAKEPNLFLLNNVAQRFDIPDDAPLSMEIPVMGAIRAYPVKFGGGYRAEQLPFSQRMTTINIVKWGAMSELTDEIIARSIWNLVGLYLKALGDALYRAAEENLFQALRDGSQVVFDNNSADSTYYTTGQNTSGGQNFSWSFSDMIKIVGVVLNNRYSPDLILGHPLGWMVFATDPIMRAQFMNGGQIGQQIWSTAPTWDQGMNVPWGMQFTPYYAVPYTEGGTLNVANGAGSGLPAAFLTDLFVLDRRNSLVLATQGDVDMDQMGEWMRDTTVMKARWYFNAAIKDLGKGVATAKGIRVVQNYEPIMTVRTQSA